MTTLDDTLAAPGDAQALRDFLARTAATADTDPAAAMGRRVARLMLADLDAEEAARASATERPAGGLLSAPQP